MTERTNITNLLLLSVLTAILLVSGSLQCAFDCLTLGDDQPATAISVNSCHLDIAKVESVDSCLNKACHMISTSPRDLGSPEIHSAYKMPQPLLGNSRQVTPQFRAGSPLILPQIDLQPQLAFQATTSEALPQTLSVIRSTILLN